MVLAHVYIHILASLFLLVVINSRIKNKRIKSNVLHLFLGVLLFVNIFPYYASPLTGIVAHSSLTLVLIVIIVGFTRNPSVQIMMVNSVALLAMSLKSYSMLYAIFCFWPKAFFLIALTPVTFLIALAGVLIFGRIMARDAKRDREEFIISQPERRGS